ncbi:unnamed protein product [Lota lota]
MTLTRPDKFTSDWGQSVCCAPERAWLGRRSISRIEESQLSTIHTTSETQGPQFSFCCLVQNLFYAIYTATRHRKYIALCPPSWDPEVPGVEKGNCGQMDGHAAGPASPLGATRKDPCAV